jgi:hypothetical protein
MNLPRFGWPRSKHARTGTSWVERLTARLRIDVADDPKGATLRHDDGAVYDVATEFNAYADEQVHIWRATGTEASRSARIRAAEVSARADAARSWVEVAAGRRDEATRAKSHADRHLLPFQRRTPKARRRYVGVWYTLLLGDAAGILSAAVLFGELPILAAGQAISTAVAAVTAGSIGADVRELRLARDRAKWAEDHFTPELAPYRRLFVVPDTGRDTYGLMLRGAGVVAIAIVVAILTLRTVADDSIVGGVMYAGLALGTAVASAISSWVYADDVADLLDVYTDRELVAIGQFQQAAADPSIAEHDAAEVAAASIEAEHQQRGAAAAAHIRGLLFGIYRRFPAIFGHGVAGPRGDGRREFHNGDPVSGLGFHKLVPTPIRHARIGRRVARPAARNVYGQDGGDAAQ